MLKTRSGLRLFALYAGLTLVPIALLGFVLAGSLRSDLDARGLADGETTAHAFARGIVDPVLSGDTLADGPTRAERRALTQSFRTLLDRGDALVIRLRDRAGHVVFDPAHPDRGPFGPPDDEVADAIRGRRIRLLTRVNADAVDSGHALGAAAIEVYTPIAPAASPRQALGALEIYVPYAPIKQSIDAQFHHITLLLVIGMFALWSVLAVITWSVTQRIRRAAQATETLAHTDLLTGLGNRMALARELTRTAEGPESATVLLVIDIADFGRINDTLGHDNGDAFLRHVADVVASHAPAGAPTARIGGDQFGVVLPHSTAADSDVFIDAVRAALRDDYTLSGVEVTAELLVGRVEGCGDIDPAELLRRADISCRHAKASNALLVDYSPVLETFDADRLGLIAELRHAIGHQELVLHYQPKIEITSGQVVGVEALLRWQHPVRGLLPPGAFVPAAESTELINDITDWVIDAACHQATAWHADGRAIPVAVNISARSLRDPDFADRVLAAANRAGTPMELISLEITETAVIADPVRAAQTLRRLTARGITVAIDDFGVGFTSLAHLRSLPIHELKIDRQFVTPLHADAHEGGAIARAVVSLGHELGLLVVAEGVEDDLTLDALAAMGCDIAQGFGIARPADAESVTAWMDARRHHRGQTVGASPNAS